MSKFHELAFCFFFVIKQLFLNATIQRYQRYFVFKEFYDNLVGNVNTTPTKLVKNVTNVKFYFALFYFFIASFHRLKLFEENLNYNDRQL